jgi:hypothetical protein
MQFEIIGPDQTKHMKIIVKFFLIDQNDLKTDLSTAFQQPKKQLRPQLGMVLNWVMGSAKKILGIEPA